MGTTDRHARDTLIERLQGDAHSYEYFQVVRLLRLLGVRVGCAQAEPNLRTRAALHLASAGGEVQQIQHDGEHGWRVSVHCFGLYGSGSPLPVYYTEDLLDEQREGRGAARGLFDLLHHALYPLLFEAWEKYRLAQRICEGRDERALGWLLAFAGVPLQRLPGKAPATGAPAAARLLRHLALLQPGPRSACGLQRMLSLELAPARVRVEQNLRRMLPIAAGQRSRLGAWHHALGIDCRVGSHVDDVGSSIAVHVEELGVEAFQALLPGQPARLRMQQLLRMYLRQPLYVDLLLRLHAQAHPPALRLGATRWACLGLDAWIDRAVDKPGLAHAGSWRSDQPTEVAA